MERLPPRIANADLFALMTDILSVHRSPDDNATLRLRLLEAGSWESLFALADEQGVTAPLIGALIQRSLLLPVPATKLRSDAQAHPTTQILSVREEIWLRRNRQREQLMTLVAALNAADIVPLLLKGARYLVAPAGDWCEARTMRDIDILVQPADAAGTVGALAKLGYAADQQPIPIEHHLPEMWREGLPSVVEIHREALAFSAEDVFSTDEIWRRATRTSTDGVSYFILSREWHLLHGLLHHQVSDRGHVRHLLPVQPLWEFAHLGSGLSNREWHAIAAHMSARGAGDILGSWIVLAGELYGLSGPARIDIAPAARAHAQKALAHARAPEWWRRSRFLADQLRYGFAAKTLAVRYEKAWPGAALHHSRFLLRRYRGRLARRLFGRG